MPIPKDDFEGLYPCDFYEPAELLDDDQMYTVYEIARLLQDLEPDADKALGHPFMLHPDLSLLFPSIPSTLFLNSLCSQTSHKPQAPVPGHIPAAAAAMSRCSDAG